MENNPQRTLSPFAVFTKRMQSSSKGKKDVFSFRKGSIESLGNEKNRDSVASDCSRNTGKIVSYFSNKVEKSDALKIGEKIKEKYRGNKNHSLSKNNTSYILNTDRAKLPFKDKNPFSKAKEQINEENTDKISLYPEIKPQCFLPLYLFNNINENKEKRKTKELTRDLLTAFESLRKKEKQLEHLRTEIKTLTKDLREVKEIKNKITNETFELENQLKKTEIENKNKLSKLKSGNNGSNLNSSSFNAFGLMNGSFNHSGVNNPYLNKTTIIHQNIDYDKEIDEYENKIAKTKVENLSLFENHDVIKNELRKNSLKNNSLRKYLMELEAKIKLVKKYQAKKQQ